MMESILNRANRLRATVVVALLAVCLCLGAFAPNALAVDSSQNKVNPQQTPDNSFLYDASIYDLANATQAMDKQTVQVTGEVVGDIIAHGGDETKKWITLSSLEDGREATIAVLVSAEDAQLIDTLGRYNTTGTTLRVKGTFHLVCAEDEGETDLHAETVSVAAVGQSNFDTFNIEHFIPGAVCLAFGLALLLLFWLISERRR